MSDLKDRLRRSGQADNGTHYGTVWYRNPDGPEAADRIDHLEAEVERLTAELAEAHRGWDSDSAARHRLLKEVRDLSAQVERLTALVKAADAMRNGIHQAGVKREPGLYEHVMAYDVARAALVAGEGEGERAFLPDDVLAARLDEARALAADKETT